MSKFKKCDYCHQSSKHFHKLKSQNALFDGKKAVGTQSGGGYIKEVPVIAFLCDVCYDYFTGNDKNSSEALDITTIPELQEMMNNKKKRPDRR